MILWCDLETTGLDPATCDILEVGLIITDDYLQWIDSQSWLIKPPDHLHSQLDPVVFDMHTKSGLLEDVARLGMPPQFTEQLICSWLDDRNLSGEPWMLAGNSIHFDRSFIKALMPDVESRLTYRMIDVSTIKELVKRWKPDAAYVPLGGKPHRALADAHQSINELRYYQRAGVLTAGMIVSDNAD